MKPTELHDTMELCTNLLNLLTYLEVSLYQLGYVDGADNSYWGLPQSDLVCQPLTHRQKKQVVSRCLPMILSQKKRLQRTLAKLELEHKDIF